MVVEQMIEAGIEEIKQKVRSFCENRDLEALTPELAEEVSGGIKQAILDNQTPLSTGA